MRTDECYGTALAMIFWRHMVFDVTMATFWMTFLMK